MTDDEFDEPRAMLAAAAIARMACAMPTDLAIEVLMLVVTEMIQASPNAMRYWETLATGIEAHQRMQRRFVRGSDRLQ
jgi:hypothetical protein